MEAAGIVGLRKLRDPSYSLAEAVTAHEKGNNEVFEGLLLRQAPLYPHDAPDLSDTRILILHDALEPETLDEEVLTTEAGLPAIWSCGNDLPAICMCWRNLALA